MLADETLVALARRGAFDPAEAKKLPGFDGRRHAGFVPAWAEALAVAELTADSAPFEEPEAPVLSPKELDRLDRAVAKAVEAKAAELALPPELLLPRRLRDALLAGWDGRELLSPRLEGFRRELLGPALDAVV